MSDKIRSGIVGARRGRHHGHFYENSEMELAAFCDINPVDLDEAVAEFRAKGMYDLKGYSSYQDMLDSEGLDIVHIVTSPAVPRAQWIEPAADAGVKVLLLEKPIALMPSEYHAVVRAVALAPDMLVTVNHQRQYMDFAEAYMDIREQLGDIKHIIVQSQGEIMEMGSHVADLLLMLTGEQLPDTVWAMVNGGTCYEKPNLQCPDNLLAMLVFPGGTRAMVTITLDGLSDPDWTDIDREKYTIDHFPNRLNLWVYGDSGKFWWREYGNWGYNLYDYANYEMTEEAHASDYFNDDIPAQQKLTDDMGLYIQGHLPRGKVRNRFELADKGMQIIFAMYRSAYYGEKVRSYCTQDEWELLKAALIKENTDA